MPTEVSGLLVDPTVFKTDESGTAGLAGSIPVRLRFTSIHALRDTRGRTVTSRRGRLLYFEE